MTAVALRAPAKINLYLHVTGKREDGYHLLDSLAVFADEVSDIVRVEDSDDFSVSVSGPFADGVGEDNLVTRAAWMFFEDAGIAAHCKIHLEKNIPIGAGLGGGSADAAATIHALEDLHGVKFKGNLLALGADVPVCYESVPCRFEGIGEKITSVPALPTLFMVLIHPGKHSSTKDVFAKCNGDYEERAAMPAGFDNLKQFLSFLSRTDNVLTDAAEFITPDIKAVREFLEVQSGCFLARMSGSGSCVFGIFDSRAKCNNIELLCKQCHPEWWVRAVTI